MTVELFANQPATTVSSGGTDAPASGTTETWTVASSAAFPAASSTATPPTQFHVADPAAGKASELIAVSNVSGTTWTVTRGAESTTPLAHSAGFTVYQVVSAGVFGSLAQANGTLEGSLTVTGDLSGNGWQLPVLPPSTRPPAWRTASFSQQFQSGHGWTTGGTGVGSSNLNDTTTFCRGTQSVSVTTAGNGGQANVLKLSGTVPDLTGKAVRIICQVQDITHLRSGGVNFYVGTSGLGNTFKWRLNLADATSMLFTDQTWVTLTASWANTDSASGSFTLTGGVPSQTSGFTDMQFQMLDDDSGTVTFNLQAIEVITDTPATFPGGVASIVFDDSYQSQYDLARPVMDALGYRGTLYTIAEAIGESGSLTAGELGVLQSESGWEIAGHAYTRAAHAARYPNLTAAEVDDDARNMRAWLATNGLRGDSFAYPGGNFENTTDGVPVDSIVARYFSSGRTILNTILAGTNYGNSEMFPPPMPFRLRAIEPITSDISGAPNVTNLLASGSTFDKCADNGGWMFLVFHELVTGSPTDTLQCQQSDFQSLMNGLSSRGITVLPAGDVMRYYS